MKMKRIGNLDEIMFRTSAGVDPTKLFFLRFFSFGVKLGHFTINNFFLYVTKTQAYQRKTEKFFVSEEKKFGRSGSSFIYPTKGSQKRLSNFLQSIISSSTMTFAFGQSHSKAVAREAGAQKLGIKIIYLLNVNLY